MTRGPAPRSSRLRRFVSALLGALVLSMGAAQDGYGLRACAHHDAAGGGAAAHAHAGHASDPTGSRGDAPCTCVGTCNASADLPALPLPHLSALVGGTLVPDRGERVTSRRAVAHADHLLPFSTAPPLL